MKKQIEKEEIKKLIAQRVASELESSTYINLGSGIPALAANYIKGDKVFLHGENGVLGMGPQAKEKEIDPNIINALRLPITELPGITYFSSVESFAMIRGGHIDTVVLGVYQVDQTGVIANWSMPGTAYIGIGGAMDLLEGTKKVIVAMLHNNKKGGSKIVKKLSYPKSSLKSVDMIITELAVFKVINKQLYLIELVGEKTTIDDVKSQTEADFIVSIES